MSIMNDLSHGIFTNSLGAWKGEQETDSSEAVEGSEPSGHTDDSSSALLVNAQEVVGPPPPPEGQRFQNAAEANPAGPPGPPGLVLENESLVANDFRCVAVPAHILQTAMLARRAVVAVLIRSNLQLNRLVSCSWLQPPRVPPLARRGPRAPMRENITPATLSLGFAAIIGIGYMDLLCDKSEQQAVTCSGLQ